MERYVIYEKVSGSVVSSGKIDRQRDDARRDGSTTLEYVERRVSEDGSLGVLYCSLSVAIDRNSHKVTSGQIIERPWTELDAQRAIEQARQDELQSMRTDLVGFLATMPYDRVETYIDSNVKDLAGARTFLKQLSKAVVCLAKRV